MGASPRSVLLVAALMALPFAVSAAADPPRVFGSQVRDHIDNHRGDRGRDHDRDRGRDHDRDRGRDHGRDHGRDRDHDNDRARWSDRRGHDHDRHRDRERYRDRYRDHYRRGDHHHHSGDRDRNRYSFGLFLGSPYGYDDYPRYRDDCRVVYRSRYDRWGRRFSERVRECYDGYGRPFYSPWGNGW